MKKTNVRTLDFINQHVISEIIEKYGLDEKIAMRRYFMSETYKMVLDEELGIYMMSPYIILDMWETEQITGEPRNSLYLRSDEHV